MWCRFYRTGLMVALPSTTVIGFTSGVTDVITAPTPTKGLTKFLQVSELTAIGVFTGLTYPITFPFLAFNAFSDRLQ
jgi:hypothetical protein